MDLYLMQHGQALSEEDDPERPLSREGISRVQASAAAMKKLAFGIDVIVCSPKKRSHQSAALVAEGINYPHSDIVETPAVKALAPPAETVTFLRQFAGQRGVLIAGHLPSLQKVASYLLTGGEDLAIAFENGGLLCLDCPALAPGQVALRWALLPAQLRLLGGNIR